MKLIQNELGEAVIITYQDIEFPMPLHEFDDEHLHEILGIIRQDLHIKNLENRALCHTFIERINEILTARANERAGEDPGEDTESEKILTHAPCPGCKNTACGIGIGA